jgi:flagellar basal body-associated protein FliL
MIFGLSPQTVIMIVVGIIFVIILGAGSIFLMAKNRNNKKYPFLLYNKANPDKPETHYPKTLRNPENKSQVFFLFPNGEKLEVRSPTLYMNGTWYREITFNNRGEYTYLKGRVIDDEEFLKTALLPEEKEIAIQRTTQYVKRYEESVGKYQAVALIANLVLILILVIGIVYSVIQFASFGESNQKAAEEVSKSTQALNSISDNYLKVTDQLAIIASALTGEDLKRPIS